MSSSRRGRVIESALTQKGFEKTKDGDHYRYYFYDLHTGATLSQTKMSHGVLGETIGAPLISQMARQLHLTKAQFLALIDCTIDEEQYRAILRDS
jgi:hypothetical protein